MNTSQEWGEHHAHAGTVGVGRAPSLKLGLGKGHTVPHRKSFHFHPRMVLGTLPYPPITPSERSHSHFYSDPAFICRPIKKDTQPSRFWGQKDSYRASTKKDTIPIDRPLDIDCTTVTSGLVTATGHGYHGFGIASLSDGVMWCWWLRPHVPHKCKGTPGAGGLCTQTLSLLFQQFFMSPPVVFIVPYRLVHGSWIPA
ncbi:hypothetical protein V6N12_012375 [Hibiscus sabdariffa]|uniref:Uncharacterized protein n=1 Tax=Hibiscus sabdariffa TaxID=183260 RepID=A0ABR2CJS8_9ROSI